MSQYDPLCNIGQDKMPMPEGLKPKETWPPNMGDTCSSQCAEPPGLSYKVGELEYQSKQIKELTACILATIRFNMDRGYISFDNKEAAQTARILLDGWEISFRKIQV